MSHFLVLLDIGDIIFTQILRPNNYLNRKSALHSRIFLHIPYLPGPYPRVNKTKQRTEVVRSLADCDLDPIRLYILILRFKR